MVPQAGQPVLFTLTVKNVNPTPEAHSIHLYVDGDLKLNGTTTVPSHAAKKFTHSYLPDTSILTDRSIKAHAKIQNLENNQVYDEFLQIPPYPPEIWSSYASFASFSSILRENVTTGLIIGLIFSLTPIGLLIFIELTEPTNGEAGWRLQLLRRRYKWLSKALLLIFLSMVLTRIVMIIG